MNPVILPNASIPATAGGAALFTAAEVSAQTGVICGIVNPSVDIAIISSIPGSNDTYANSPMVCPAGVPTVIYHRSGPMMAISSSGTATVKRALGCTP